MTHQKGMADPFSKKLDKYSLAEKGKLGTLCLKYKEEYDRNVESALELFSKFVILYYYSVVYSN